MKEHYQHAAALTPSDTDSIVADALYVEAQGATDSVAASVTVQMAGGEEVTFNNVPTGKILPIKITKLLATGTTTTSVTYVGLR